MTDKYSALIAKMQDAVRNYIEPVTYIRKTKGGTCKVDSEVKMPSKHHSNAGRKHIQHRRDTMFINDIIYFLDSEEHGTNKLVEEIRTSEDLDAELLRSLREVEMFHTSRIDNNRGPFARVTEKIHRKHSNTIGIVIRRMS